MRQGASALKAEGHAAESFGVTKAAGKNECPLDAADHFFGQRLPLVLGDTLAAERLGEGSPPIGKVSGELDGEAIMGAAGGQ
jgi:hypothetical protein